MKLREFIMLMLFMVGIFSIVIFCDLPFNKELPPENVATTKFVDATNSAVAKTWVEEINEKLKKDFDSERAEFNNCVTNRANWRIISNGIVFNVEFYKPSTGWQPYGLFPDAGTAAETERTIQFYINYFKSKQERDAKTWTNVPPIQG